MIFAVLIILYTIIRDGIMELINTMIMPVLAAIWGQCTWLNFAGSIIALCLIFLGLVGWLFPNRPRG